MTSSSTKKTIRSQAFTLIELFVVISVIAILASLAFPVVNGALDSAKKAQAKNNAVQIATAVVAFETEYGRLPGNGTTTVDLTLIKTLTGADAVSNPRAIVFLEAPAWKKGKGGTNSSGYCDPWTETTPYSIALDTDYNNKVDVSTNGSASASYSIMKKVGVWNISTNSKYRVNSWD